jgi:hypothetical protein
MLTLLLSAADGGTSWRHLLAPGEARAGFEQVGPLGLARRLGRILGFPAQPAEAPARLAVMAARLDAHDDGTRAYSASRRRDPFGVARFLLGLRDELTLAGWDGRALEGSGRLADLAALERLAPPLPPGLPDVLAGLVAALAAPGALPFPVAVRLAAPRDAFAPLLVRLLDALAAAGAAVEGPAAPTPLAGEATDLGRLQRALLDPAAPAPRLTGDGSLLLLEADTPVEAAELTASFARGVPLADATFVVAAEPAVLDAALRRQGLPTTGLATASPLRPHLQVLPLRLLLAFAPQDPFRAAELLLLPGAPLPAHARGRLLGALSQMPGLGSPAWVEAVEAAVAGEVERAAGRGRSEAAARAEGEALREKLEAWFGGPLHDPVAGIPAPEAAARCAFVARWAGGRVQAAAGEAEADPASGAGDDAQLWAQAAAVARTLERLLLARPPGELVPAQALMQLHDLAVGSGAELAAFDREAGRPALAASPDAVLAPSATVAWWGFVDGAGPGPHPAPWTEAERAALAAAGLVLRAPGALRGVEADGWRRPLLLSRERAVLVRWRLAGAEPVAPHPFHDELATRLAPGSLEACTLASERLLGGGAAPFAAATEPVAPGAPMAQRAAWRVAAGALAPAGELSASSLETLLGCPFRWALEHQAALRPGGVDLPDGSRLLGDFAHRVLQDMLCGPERLDFDRATEAEAHAWAARTFDARVAREAAPLVRRGAEVERDRARTLVADAAAALLRILRQGGWRPVDAEREVAGAFAGRPARGYVDLVVEKDGREAVVDLKLSGLKHRREALEQGHALQLALYAALVRPGGAPLPPTGYFVLSEGQLLTVDGAAFPGAAAVDGPSMEATLAGAAEGFRYWSRVLGAGLLPSLKEGLPWEEAVTAAAGPPPGAETPARRELPCRFCHYAAVCAPSAGEEVAP